VTSIVGHRTGGHVSSNHFPAGSRVVMLPVLVIGPENPRAVIPEREDSTLHESVSASRQAASRLRSVLRKA
jgi:hypothetical protein